MEFNVKRIKAERIARGISQKSMAEKLGYRNPSAYTKIENGKSKLSMDTFMKIVGILGYRGSDILIFFN